MLARSPPSESLHQHSYVVHIAWRGHRMRALHLALARVPGQALLNLALPIRGQAAIDVRRVAHAGGARRKASSRCRSVQLAVGALPAREAPSGVLGHR